MCVYPRTYVGTRYVSAAMRTRLHRAQFSAAVRARAVIPQRYIYIYPSCFFPLAGIRNVDWISPRFTGGFGRRLFFTRETPISSRFSNNSPSPFERSSFHGAWRKSNSYYWWVSWRSCYTIQSRPWIKGRENNTDGSIKEEDVALCVRVRVRVYVCGGGPPVCYVNFAKKFHE